MSQFLMDSGSSFHKSVEDTLIYLQGDLMQNHVAKVIVPERLEPQ
jgi:hypothetical protein